MDKIVIQNLSCIIKEILYPTGASYLYYQLIQLNKSTHKQITHLDSSTAHFFNQIVGSSYVKTDGRAHHIYIYIYILEKERGGRIHRNNVYQSLRVCVCVCACVCVCVCEREREREGGRTGH